MKHFLLQSVMIFITPLICVEYGLQSITKVTQRFRGHLKPLRNDYHIHQHPKADTCSGREVRTVFDISKKLNSNPSAGVINQLVEMIIAMKPGE